MAEAGGALDPFLMLASHFGSLELAGVGRGLLGVLGGRGRGEREDLAHDGGHPCCGETDRTVRDPPMTNSPRAGLLRERDGRPKAWCCVARSAGAVGSEAGELSDA